MLQPAPSREASDDLSRAIALAVGLIGRPWRAGADGPEAFDCYGLVRHVMRELFGIALPEAQRPPEPLSVEEAQAAIQRGAEAYQDFLLPGPEHGAVMLAGRAREPSHVGVFLALPPAGGVLHADERAGQVVFEDLHSMRRRGYVHLHWYRPA